MLQVLVAHVEVYLSEFYLAAAGVSIWVHISTGSRDITGIGYVCEFLVSKVARKECGAPT